ncbi:DUF4817 domain-containing protein [Trichonephila clavipes]|uniref:DUF4817 domain-containing protein n=1 Tax=Trichonephila clavipes TaxID=2585209 RepID=A0A8X6VAV1_TRICX|nr:DUF4817 domain-containing protein [Trichonephila clavipes]
MNRLTPEQRFQSVQFYFENNRSVRNTYRALLSFYRRQNRPSEQLIRLTMERFRTTFTLIDNSHPQRLRTVRTEGAIATAERSIEEDPNESIHHRAQELDMGPSTLWKILRKDLGLRAYKIQLVQELKPNDHQARSRFIKWAQNEIAVVPDFHKRILFSDEAHFWLNGYVNKQNCRIWSEANPQVHVETPLHPEKLTVWSALWAGGIIGPYFYKTMKAPTLQSMELWFQHDGAACHTARATIDLLKDTFGDRLISRFGHVNWPPRSCDLTPLDYFLWSYVKSLVYADKQQTLDHLQDNIRRVIADIRPQMLEKVIENWTSRLDYIRASCCSHMPEIIFKIKTTRTPSHNGDKSDFSVVQQQADIQSVHPAYRVRRERAVKWMSTLHSIAVYTEVQTVSRRATESICVVAISR